MASPLAIAIRRQAALDRLSKSLGLDPAVQSKDPGLAEAMLLERIADAADKQAKALMAAKKSLREAKADDK